MHFPLTLLIGIVFIMIPYAIGLSIASTHRRSYYRHLVTVVRDSRGDRRIVCQRDTNPITERVTRKLSGHWFAEWIMILAITLAASFLGLRIANGLHLSLTPLIYAVIFFCLTGLVESVIWQRQDFLTYLEQANQCKEEGSVHYRATMTDDCISPVIFVGVGPLDGIEVLTEKGDERLAEINSIYRSQNWSTKRKYSA